MEQFFEDVLLYLFNRIPRGHLRAEQLVLVELVQKILFSNMTTIIQVAEIFCLNAKEDNLKQLTNSISMMNAAILNISSKQLAIMISVLYVIIMLKRQDITTLGATVGQILASEFINCHSQRLIDVGGIKGMIARDHKHLYIRYKLKTLFCF